MAGSATKERPVAEVVKDQVKQIDSLSSEVQSAVKGRLKDLDKERNELEALLAKVAPEPAPAPEPEPSPAPQPRTRRSRKGGTRAEQVVQVVTDNPGSSATEIAKQLKIKPNYLYRIMKDLVAEKVVRRDGRTYHPVS